MSKKYFRILFYEELFVVCRLCIIFVEEISIIGLLVVVFSIVRIISVLSRYVYSFCICF